jgi:hypothetical protein
MHSIHDFGSNSIMPPTDDGSGDELRETRRRILERRREARKDDLDRMIEKKGVGRAPAPAPSQVRTRGPDRRQTERRESLICFVCHGEFVPTASGQTVCAQCTLDGVRGGGRTGWRSPRF